ncbi:011a36a3-7401-4e4e-b207-c1d164605912 [Sclerotinia trifoliorum]|uniref:011a36a3-7401-4e4e-b207-c1d164605912 n=1 Tax=Sclerotinia trifoliorum TaxID=28548 RepID=A0A8H2VWR8_9HELO|nr:011a36a3-7401-4e4e-b207-c1d164605912 [Sclerotinia trifoliorum]
MSSSKRNGNIRQFFQQASPLTSAPPTKAPRNTSQIAFESPLSTSPQSSGLDLNTATEPMSSQKSSPSLSEPPTSIPQSSSNISNGVVPGSDDEDEDGFSDSSLEDLDVIFKTNRTASVTTSSCAPAPATPRASRSRKPPVSTAKLSPLTLRTPHYKFDLKHLMGSAAADAALEAKERRLEEMVQEDTEMGEDEPTSFKDDVHGNILRELNEEKEDGGGKEVQKVLDAVKRTEEMNVGNRWYFFETKESPMLKRQPFPTPSLPENWKNDLFEPQTRHQTFVSGFAENMVTYGKKLPDEIIQWILNDFCMEEQNDLQNSYLFLLRISGRQVHGLVTPEVIRKMFRSIGATTTAITVSEKIKPRPEIADAYSHQPWPKVRALISLINLIAKPLQEASRLEVICILLRLCIDPILLERVDLLSLVQKALHNLCLYMDPDSWEQSYQTICATLFNTVQLSSLRLRIINSIPPTRSSRLHGLRRRLALTFYFSSLSKSLHPPQKIISIPAITLRLREPPFHITPSTDYHEFGALILLLDVAIDDGRPEDLDLADEDVEKQFNKDVDELTNRLTTFDIKASGAQHSSRMEAKENLSLVERRIEHTVRTRPKPKNMFYEETKKFYERRQEALGGMQKSMSNFVKKAN